MSRRLPTVLLMTAAIIVMAATAGPASAQTVKAGGDGFVRQWLVCGTWPISETRRNLLPDDQLPYEGLVTMGRLWVVATANESGFVDLAGLGGHNQQATLAHAYLHSPQRQKVKLLIGSDDRAHLAVNGSWLHQSTRSGPWKPDQETVEATLDQGWNQVLLRVENNWALYGFSVRVTLPDGRPAALQSSAQVPEELMMRPAMRTPLSQEALAELTELMTNRTQQTVRMLNQVLRSWADEGDALDESYDEARLRAVTYVTALREVLEAMPQPDVADAEQPDLPHNWQLARRHLREAAADGPGPLMEASATLLDHARVGARLWQMGHFAASSPLEIGHYAGEIDRTLSDTTALVSQIRRQHLRPYRLREQTLRHRTAPMTISLIGADGEPLSEVKYEVEQLNHEFLFGCNLFAFGAFDDSEDNERYQQRFAELFNHAIVPVYWSLLEPRQAELHFQHDQRGLPGPDAIVDWCLERGISIRLSPLLSTQALPRWLHEKSADEIRQASHQHLRRLVDRYGQLASHLELRLERWRAFPLGKLQLDLPYVLDWISDDAPQANLHLGSSSTSILTRGAKYAEEHGRRLEGLTLVFDQSRSPLPIEDLEAQLGRLQSARLPVHLCQVAVSGSRRNELAQAEAVEAIYRTAFANPMISGISWWDLSDRFARGRQPVGLLDSNLRAKEAYHRLVRLIKGEWWTSTSGQSGDEGEVAFRGYYGDYRLTLTITGADGRPRQIVHLLSLGRDDPQSLVIRINEAATPDSGI